jgi:hypothetical protein
MFEYHEADDGWGDTFRIVDDDGMPFHLVDLKRFNGRGVRITIEFDERMDAEANKPSDTEPPLVHQRLGVTREAYRKVRERMREP